MFLTNSRFVDFMLTLFAGAFLSWDVLSGGFLAHGFDLLALGAGGAAFFLGFDSLLKGERPGIIAVVTRGLACMLIFAALARLGRLTLDFIPRDSFNWPHAILIAILAIVFSTGFSLWRGSSNPSDTPDLDDDDDEDEGHPPSQETMIHVGRHKVPLNADGYISIR